MNNTLMLILSMITSSALAQMVPLTPKQTSQAKTDGEYVTLTTVIPAMNILPGEIWKIVYQYASTSECITQQIFPTPLPENKRCFYCVQLQHPREYAKLYESNLDPEQAILLLMLSSYEESLFKQLKRNLLCTKLIDQIAAHYGANSKAIWQALRSLSTQEQLLLIAELVQKYGDIELQEEATKLFDQKKESAPGKAVAIVKDQSKCACPAKPKINLEQKNLNFARSALL